MVEGRKFAERLRMGFGCMPCGGRVGTSSLSIGLTLACLAWMEFGMGCRARAPVSPHDRQL